MSLPAAGCVTINSFSDRSTLAVRAPSFDLTAVSATQLPDTHLFFLMGAGSSKQPELTEAEKRRIYQMSIYAAILLAAGASAESRRRRHAPPPPPPKQSSSFFGWGSG